MKSFALTCLLTGLVLIAASTSVMAQSEIPQINLNENWLGEITPQNPAARFTFISATDMPVRVEVQSLQIDFAPVLVVYNGDQRLAHQPNAVGAPKISLDFLAQADVQYSLQVLGVGGEQGQFVLGIYASDGRPIPMTEITIPQTFHDSVTLATPVKRYQFTSLPNAAVGLEVVSSLPDGGISFVLSDLNGTPLATSHQRLLGSRFLIPAATGARYELMVYHSGADRRESYTISIQLFQSLTPFPTATPQSVPSSTLPPQPTITDTSSPISQNAITTTQTVVLPQIPTSTPTSTASMVPATTTPTPTMTFTATAPVPATIPDDGPCAVTTLNGQGVNIRRGPGEEYEIVSGLTQGQIMIVTGRDENTEWWQVERSSGIYGWVADDVVRRGGDCTQIGVAPYPTPQIFATPTR